MHFTDDLLGQHDVTAAACEALHRRQRGALAGGAGYEYQRRYAIFRVLECATAEDARIDMEALCPVDDVVVETLSGHEHAQVKRSATESWGADGRKLECEFLEQRRLLRASNVHFTLTLVTPHEQRANELRRRMHWGLRTTTTVRHFPEPEVDARPWTVPEVSRALDTLTVPELSGASQREHLYAAMSHVCGTPWQVTTARVAVRACAQARHHLPIRCPRTMAVPPVQWAAAKAILAQIPELQVRVVDGVCFYVYGYERRFIATIDNASFVRFVARVLQVKPATIDALAQELP